MTRQAIQMTLLVILAFSMVACSGCNPTPIGGDPGPTVLKVDPITGGDSTTIDIGGPDTDVKRPSGEPVPIPLSLMKTIYFDFDRSGIRPDQRAQLEGNAEYLKQNLDKKILIEGHCDERGTLEYNMALGTRRAEAVIDFLVKEGVARNRLMAATRGEESPAVEGTGEAVWAKNRRAEFYYVD